MNNRTAKMIRRKTRQTTNEIFKQGVRELMAMPFLQRLSFAWIIVKGAKRK